MNTDRKENSASRLLVVEDDLHTSMLLEKILLSHGYQVTIAIHGAEALELLQNKSDFDLIVSDWVMPEMDGLELCSRIKADEMLRQIYFIILSSKDLSQDKVAALEAGVDDYLAKPFDRSELVARIRAGLRVRKLQKEVIELERTLTVVQLATTAGHEINNPLTGIIGFVDLLREGLRSGQPSEKLLKYVDNISAEAERIQEVVARLASLRNFQTKPYLGDQQMIDLEQSSTGGSVESGEENPSTS